ncbi:MAG: FAD-dependent monooxygenase, partial [Stellaceae bacterium]
MVSRAPVIVVGGGPAGLAIAAGLALGNVAVAVYEAEPCLPRDLRAGSFHPPTLEMLDGIGVGQDFLALGYR